MAKTSRISRKEIFALISEIENDILDLRRQSIFTFVTYSASNISGFAAYAERFFIFASNFFQGLRFDYQSPNNSDELWFWLWHPASGLFANDLIENLSFYTDKNQTELDQMNDIASDLNRRLDAIEGKFEKVKEYLTK